MTAQSGEASARALADAMREAARLRVPTAALVGLLRSDPEVLRLVRVEVDLSEVVIAARGEAACYLTASKLALLREALRQAQAAP